MCNHFIKEDVKKEQATGRGTSASGIKSQKTFNSYYTGTDVSAASAGLDLSSHSIPLGRSLKDGKLNKHVKEGLLLRGPHY